MTKKNPENPGGWGGPPETLWNGNSRGVGGLKLNDHPWGGYGYFLETHNVKKKTCREENMDERHNQSFTVYTVTHLHVH